jgi:hypothetical protein
VHVDDGGQGEGACFAAPEVQCVRDVQHGSFSAVLTATPRL